jgi:hypothetical protein
MEIALKPEKPEKDRFGFILVIHDGEESRQFLVAQWGPWIIFMNGDDYAHRKKTKRMALDTARLPSGPLFLTLTTGSQGTKLYCDGALVEERRDLTLTIPTAGNPRLVLGNSPYATHSWHGDINGLAFYESTLTEPDVAAHFNRWSQERSFAFAKPEAPCLLFLFDENGGRQAMDHSGGGHALIVPKRIRPWKQHLLEPPWRQLEFKWNSAADIFINILGFIPFGFFLAAFLTGIDGHVRRHRVLISVSVCLTVSLFIEVFQAWVPSRSSSSLDLMLNGFGGWLGTVTYRRFVMGA